MADGDGAHDDVRLSALRYLSGGQLDPVALRELIGHGPSQDTLARVDAMRAALAEAEFGATAADDMAGTLLPSSFDGDFGSASMAGHPTGDDRYTLVERIGAGGIGEVWLARDELLEREVALKFLRPEAATSEEARSRFLYESQTTARLGHPGVIPVYDFGSLRDGRTFYAMQRISGRTLESVLQGLQGDEAADVAAYPLPRLLSIFAGICRAVAFAHDHGVLHRDLKPANLMLGAYGEVYVADWGLAKLVGAETPGVAARRSGAETSHGVVMGTLPYMSPEQIRGDNEVLAPPADVWSLGVILFELLTLRRPFRADTHINLMFQIVSNEPPSARASAPAGREVPVPLEELVHDALRRRPDQRPSAVELAERVDAFLHGVEELARREERARDLLERATQLRDLYLRASVEIDDRMRGLELTRGGFTLSTPRDTRRTLWVREQQLAERSLAAEAHHTRALQLAHQSLEESDNAEARRLLADLYWIRVQAAEGTRDLASAQFFRALVEQHDDGTYRDRLAQEGALDVQVAAPGAEVSLDRVVPLGPLLISEAGDFGERGTLPVGVYIAAVSAPGRMSVRVPVRVGGGPQVLAIDPPARFAGDEEFCFVNGGVYPVGGDPDAPECLRGREVTVASFLLGTHPVTLRRYVEFLDAVAATDPSRARSHAPRSNDGTVVYLPFDEESGRFTVPEADQDGDAWSPDWPALMVSHRDAEAYCAWRSERDGVGYRLPTEDEWEVAARGVDRRAYPWGNGFDPTLCRMVDSAETRPMPVPVGRYELDRSPFGVQDMGGLAIEWTATRRGGGETAQVVQRGGGFSSPHSWCRAAARRANFPDQVFAVFGFRIVRALPE